GPCKASTGPTASRSSVAMATRTRKERRFLPRPEGRGLRATDAMTRQSLPTLDERIDPRSITVLVVDDEPRLADVVRMNLEVEGYRVLTAANGMEALARLTQDLPDLVVLDVMMPEM